MNALLLERAYMPDGTFGLMHIGDTTLHSLERPWLGNKPFVSCIPEGVYRLRKRESGVMNRSTGGEFPIGWEVTNVPDRTFIMIHPANFVWELNGCISLGLGSAVMPDKHKKWQQAVTRSRDAIRTFMDLLEAQDEWDLEIIPKLIQYP